MKNQPHLRILMVGAFGNSYYVPNRLQCQKIAESYFTEWSQDCGTVRLLMLAGF